VDDVRPIHNARQGKKIDKQVCLKCNMHVKNPIGASNGCTHEYPSNG
jgi:ribosomal protein L40E